MNDNPNYYNNTNTDGYNNPQGYNNGGNPYGYQGYNQNGYYNQGYYGQGYGTQTGYQNVGVYSYYQNLYNMFGGHNPIIEKEFAQISRRGLVTGFLLLSVFLLQIVASFVISLFPISQMYRNDLTFSMSFGIVMQMLYMLLPFMIAYLVSKPEERKVMNVFNKPKTKQLYVLGAFAGLAVCLIGNLATSFFAVILSVFGVSFFSGSEGMEIPTTAFSIIVFVINTAVMPALLEEFAFRGVIMQPLRKYGDWFAILISAFCFAIVHGNMVQIPFAFIAGISLGYFCIKTKSIWTSVTIHFLNNLISVIFSVYYEKVPDAGMAIYYIVIATLILIGTVAMIVFRMSCTVKLKKDATVMNKKQTLKKAAFVTSPTVVCAFFFALFTSLNLMEITSILGLLTIFGGLFVTGYILIKWNYNVRTDNSINHRKGYTASLVLTIVSCAVLAVLTLFSIG